MRVGTREWVVSESSGVTQKTSQAGGLASCLTLAHTALYGLL